MDKVLLVFLGGGLGSVVRYLLQVWLNAPPESEGIRLPSIPWGTFGANVLGCGVAGALVALGSTRLALDEHARLLLAVGFLGGFTTFSAMSSEMLTLGAASSARAAGYVVASNVAALSAAWVVFVVVRALGR